MPSPRESLQSLPAPTKVFWAGLAFEGGLGIAAIVLIWLTGMSMLSLRSIFDASFYQWMVWIAQGLLGAFIMFVPIFWVMKGRPKWAQTLLTSVDDVLVPMFQRLNVYQIACLAAAAGFGEELLFRSFLQDGLPVWTSPLLNGWGSWLVASVLFGLVHYLNFSYAVFATCFGLLLGAVYVLCQSIVPPMIAHAVYDFMAIVYLVRVYSIRRESL
jgi:uncharacterized protein